MENGGSRIDNFTDARRLIHIDFHRYVFWDRFLIKYASSDELGDGYHLSDYRRVNYR